MTQPQLLDQWWAPRPWKAKTKTMDFRPGGFWLYCMQGPEGEAHWARADYKTVEEQKSFTYIDAFCDEKGTKGPENLPNMDWKVEFFSIDAGTKVEIEILFESEEAIEKIVAMGFKEGFAAAIGNLDELLEK